MDNRNGNVTHYHNGDNRPICWSAGRIGHAKVETHTLWKWTQYKCRRCSARLR